MTHPHNQLVKTVRFTFDGNYWLAELYGEWFPLPFTAESGPQRIRDSLTTRFPGAKIIHITGG